MATAGLDDKFPFDGIDIHVTGAGISFHIAADVIDRDASGASLGIHRALQAGDLLIARAGMRRQLRLRWHIDLVADGDVIAKVFVFYLADDDATAFLPYRRIGFEPFDLLFGAQVAAVSPPITPVAGTDLGVDMHIVGLA